MSESCVVALHDVWTRRGKREVHRGVGLCLQRGEILGLVGGSGSGKTSLLRVVLDLDHPGRGTVELFGRSIDSLEPEERQQVRNRCGVLFQGGALFSSLDVFDNVAFPLREIRGLDEGLVRPLVMRTLRRVGLEPDEVAGLMPAQLSGGMVTRVALARALVREPELLLLDEPTSGLDPIATGGFIDLIRELHQRLDLTILLISHDLDTLAQLCQRIVVLADGGIVADGRFEELSRHPHPFVQRFFGGRHVPHPERRSRDG